MKLSVVLSAFVGAFLSSRHCAVADTIEEYYFRFQAGGGCVDACMGLKNGKTRSGTRAILKPCDNADAQDLLWFLDFTQGQGSARIRNKKDEAKCLQAGTVNDGAPVVDGMPLRISACENGNRKQLFDKDSIVSTENPDEVYGQLKLLDSPNLCAVYRGVVPHVSKDPIILKSCDGLDELRAKGWEGDVW